MHPAQALLDQGLALSAQGHHADAAATLARAVEQAPERAPAHLALGNALRTLGRLTEALGCYRQAVALDSEHALAWNNLGATFNDLGQPSRGLPCCDYATELDPQLALARYNRANALRDLQRPAEAVAAYRQAVVLDPQFVGALMNLGQTLSNLGHPAEGVQWLQRGLQRVPDSAVGLLNLGNALKELGRYDEAIASYRQALQIEPDYFEAHSNLLFCLSHDPSVTAEQGLAEHRACGQRLQARHCATAAALPVVDRDPGRPLQVGFVSADLRHHPVAHFLEPVLQALAPRSDLLLHAYSNHPVEDAVSQRLRSHCAHWTPVHGLSDAALAERIRGDAIDILIDLSGHTGGSRLPTFARKPAPLQLSWLGYPGTTGLPTMDYYLADHHLVPDERSRALFTEQIVYLPATAPFLPCSDAPDVNPLPALAGAPFTWASFNRMNKLSPAVVTLWARVLHRVTGSRMTLAGLGDDVRPVVTGWFAAQGIAAERLQFLPRCDLAGYLALHHAVDVCLDSFPYTGGTTTSHALWMGVPTLTLAGTAPQSRVGATVLGLLGLHDYVAADTTDYVERATQIAANLEALALLRGQLRSRMQHCPDTQAARIALAMASAFRQMWRRWCADLPPALLDTTASDKA